MTSQTSKYGISIIIPTHNRPDKLMALLESINNSTVEDYEVIVIDDHSEIPVESFVKKFAERTGLAARVIRNDINLQLTASRNIGLRAARGKYIFVVDDDNILDERCIEILRGELDKDSAIGVVGPVMLYANSHGKIWWAGTNRNMRTSRTGFIGVNDDMPASSTWHTDDFPNAWMVRKSIIDQGVVLDERYKIHYDEADYCARIAKLGYKLVVVKDARTSHDFDNSPEKANERWLSYERVYYTARNRVIFHKIYSDKLDYMQFMFLWNWVFTAYYISYILSVTKGSWRVKITSCMYYLKGSIDGYKGLPKRT